MERRDFFYFPSSDDDRDFHQGLDVTVSLEQREFLCEEEH